MASFSTPISVPLLLLLLLLLCHAALLLGGKSHCPPSSCGDMDIRSPFRLSGDPDGCGDKDFELVCEGNRTVYSDSHSEKYLVTEISSNEAFYLRRMYSGHLRLIYTGFLSDTNCLLPNHSFKSNTFGIIYSSIWASFMNCTQEVESQEYVAVPCLSASSSTTYVLVNSNSYQLLNLKNSCSFLTTVPVENLLSPGDHDIFKLLRKGFVVYWTPKHSVKYCWERSKYAFEPLGGASIIGLSLSLLYKIVDAILFGLQFLSCVCNNKDVAFVLEKLSNILAYSILASLGE